MNLQEELKTAQKCADYHRAEALAAQGRIDNLTAQIAEAEKPKLRIGDEYLSASGNFIVVEDKQGVLRPCVGTQVCYHMTAKVEDGDIYCGNRFDHLAALQEDRTDFKVDWPDGGGEAVKAWLGSSDMGIKQYSDKTWYTFGMIDELILGLQQLKATQKRKAK